MSDTVHCCFVYQLRQHVWWNHQGWTVSRRRFEQGTVSRFIQYGLYPDPEPAIPVVCIWAYEADIIAAPRSLDAST